MSAPLHIAVLVDSTSISRPVAELMAWIGAHPQLTCSAVVVLAQPEKGPQHGPRQSGRAIKPLRGLLWTLMMVIERARVRRSNLKSQLDASVPLESQPPAGGVHKFQAEGDETIIGLAQRVRKALDKQAPDFIVSCMGGTRSLVFASCAKQGLLELVHGSSHGAADGSSGFWEVLNQNDKTAFAIRHVLPGGGQVRTLVHGYLPTQTSFLMNQASLVVQLHDTLRSLLNRLAAGSDVSQMSIETVVEPLRRDKPTAAQLIRYGTGVARRAVTLRMRSLLGQQERWQIHYKRQDWAQLTLADAIAVPNPKGGYFADPFLHTTAEGVFCFVEESRDSTQRGVISVLRLEAHGAVYLGRVLDEPFHLSFPYIFEYGGELFMCPETHEAKQIRLYKCKSFPLHWELHSVAMDNVAAVDSMIFQAHGKWWMMAGMLPQGDVERFPEMHLFSAADPLSGQWQAHPKNPLKIDPEFARNGGLLRRGEKTYRVAQARAFSAYGASVNICEIQTLTEQSYDELLIARLDAEVKPGVTGLHHVDSDGGLTVWDEKRLHTMRHGVESEQKPFAWNLKGASRRKEATA